MPGFTSSDGVTLFYRDEGEGLPLLCLAGLTRDGRDFDFVAPHLQAVRLIRPDYRGRGRSERAPWQSYTVQREARDALELLDHLGLARAAILGTSRGGLIAMLLARDAKARLMGVALNDIGPEIDPAGLAVIQDYLGRVPVQKTHAEMAARRAEVLTGFRGVAESRWREEAERLFDETEDGLALRYDPALRAAFLETGPQPEPDMWPVFDALASLPLCALRGANSDLLSADTFAEMMRRRPDMIAAEVPGRGHVPFLDEPESLEALRRWLKMLR
jgi:pimeloyl-ACP methyl ester carboxylesterase